MRKQNVFQFVNGCLCSLNNGFKSMSCFMCDLLNSKLKPILQKLHHVEVYQPTEITSGNLNFYISLTNWRAWKSSRRGGPCLELCVFSYSKIFSLLNQNDSLRWGSSWASKIEYQVFHCSEAKQLYSSQQLMNQKLWQAATEHKPRRPCSKPAYLARCLLS